MCLVLIYYVKWEYFTSLSGDLRNLQVCNATMAAYARVADLDGVRVVFQFMSSHVG
jgi:hypothetical protein